MNFLAKNSLKSNPNNIASPELSRVVNNEVLDVVIDQDENKEEDTYKKSDRNSKFAKNSDKHGITLTMNVYRFNAKQIQARKRSCRKKFQYQKTPK